MRISDWSSDVCSSRSQALMKALIERRIAAEDGRIGEIEARLGPVPDVAIRARLASELRDLTDEDRSVALSLCALVAPDADLRAPIQEMRSEERRVGDEGVSMCRSGWAPDH